MVKVIQKIFLFFFFLTSAGSLALADYYKGFEEIGGPILGEIPTKGASVAGLQNTLLSTLLTGSEGEAMEIVLDGENEIVKRLPPGKYAGILQEYQRSYSVGVYHQEDKKLSGQAVDVVLLIPGFGAGIKANAARYLAEMLNREGYLTVVSRSPAHQLFISESSSFGAPGYQTLDAADLYKQFQHVLKKLGESYSIGKVSLIGASLGSMNAALMGKLDRIKVKAEQPDAINFHRVFSLNPPISNVFGSTTIDTFVAKTIKGSKIDLEERLEAYDRAIHLLLATFFVDNWNDVADSSVRALARMQRTGNTDEALKFLVGFAFAPKVAEALRSHNERWYDELTATMQIDRNFLDVDFFTAFLRDFSIPYSFLTEVNTRIPKPKREYSFLSDKCKNGTRKERYSCEAFIISENESLGVVIPEMHEAGMDLSYYYLVTWDDDFLLRVPVPGKEAEFDAYYSQNDAQWIQETLTGGVKGNSKIFTNGGGHLGGFYQAEFQKYLLDNLKSGGNAL